MVWGEVASVFTAVVLNCEVCVALGFSWCYRIHLQPI